MDEIAQAMASLYPEEGSLRRFAGIAGIAYERVGGSTPLEKWGSLMREAEIQGRAAGVIEAALREYPVYGPLVSAVHNAGMRVPHGVVEHEVDRLRRDLEKIEDAVRVLWRKMHPPLRRRVGETISRVILYAVVLTWLIPALFDWYIQNPIVAVLLIAAAIGIALLARWLPE